MSLKKSAAAYRNISEASEEIGLEAHVLRFWESRFDNLEPMTRGGGRRYYSLADMDLLRQIKTLLHDQGHTIKAANRMISETYAKSSKKSKSSRKKTSLPTFESILANIDQMIGSARADLSKINQLLS